MMDKKYPQEVDPRPKRRKSKDNPYKIYSIGIDTKTPQYFVEFNDINGVSHTIEIEESLFNEFNSFELDDLSYLNESERHHTSMDSIETFSEDITEESALKRILSEELHAALPELTEVQRKRVILYYFYDYTYEQIAQLDGCTKMPVKRSIDDAIKKLRKLLI